MNVRRGDVVLALYPFASGTGASRRPALIVQNDHDNERLHNVVIVQITTNLRRASESTHFLIELATPEGRQSGLLHDSVVSCNNLATIREDRIDSIIGHLPDVVMRHIDTCLKVTLSLP
jgi:mRNA interferase MazF